MKGVYLHDLVIVSVEQREQIKARQTLAAIDPDFITNSDDVGRESGAYAFDKSIAIEAWASYSRSELPANTISPYRTSTSNARMNKIINTWKV